MKRYGKEASCRSPILKEDVIKEKFIEAYNEIYDDRERILDKCGDMLSVLDDDNEIDAQIRQQILECEIIAGLNQDLVNENARTAMDQADVNAQYEAYAARYEKEYEKLQQLKRLKRERQSEATSLSAFMFQLHEREGFITEFDDKLWMLTVDMVVVSHDGTLTFRFKNGSEVRK